MRSKGRIVLAAVWEGDPTQYKANDRFNNMVLSNDSSVRTAAISMTDEYIYATMNTGESGQRVTTWVRGAKPAPRAPERDLLFGNLKIVDIYAHNFGTRTEPDDYIFALTKDGRVRHFLEVIHLVRLERMRYTVESDGGKFVGITGDYRGLNFYLYILITYDEDNNPYRLVEIKTSSEVERTLIWNDSLTYREGTDDEPQRRNWGNLFQYYYHHDMYGVNDLHLRPTTYIYAVSQEFRLDSRVRTEW